MTRICPPALVLLATVVACRPADPTGEVFLAALNAVPEEALQGRMKELSPILLAEDYPRIPEGVLASPRSAGIGVSVGSGMERRDVPSDAPATIYLTPPEQLGENRYQLGVSVNLGKPLGTLHRGDTWWRVTVECSVGCEAVEVLQSGTHEWGNIGR
jgi:hypothetical protein